MADFSPRTFEFSVARSLAFPSVPHSLAVLATRTRHVPDPSGHVYKVSRRAEAGRVQKSTYVMRISGAGPLPGTMSTYGGPNWASSGQPPRAKIGQNPYPTLFGIIGGPTASWLSVTPGDSAADVRPLLK
ncbi:hypothetical protein EDB89DRAFT_1910631 [Lactarius sanguifluus]|nr:hypothetical protein EDB89DRAFT_1910631 [Lactarius sanguifluus]